MTEFVDVPGGRIAYDVTGSGPQVVASHGTGDRRQACRFLAPVLAQAGYRMASADLRGRGESSMGWASITRTDVAGDLPVLIGHLGGPAVIAGHSISGRAATIAAATRPDLVAGIVEINPFIRKVQYSLGGLLRVRRHRRGISLMTAAGTGLADAALTGKGPAAPRPAPTWRRPGGSLWSASRREPFRRSAGSTSATCPATATARTGHTTSTGPGSSSSGPNCSARRLPRSSERRTGASGLPTTGTRPRWMRSSPMRPGATSAISLTAAARMRSITPSATGAAGRGRAPRDPRPVRLRPKGLG